MKKSKLIFLIIFFGFVTSCKKNSTRSHHQNQQIVNRCIKYIGTPYKFGGIDKRGLDCSGLIYLGFSEIGLTIPRNSEKQADFFKEVSKNDLQIGDLLYFKVNSKKINHTGIVSKIIKRDEIYFIHASTSSGVREDNLFSTFWHSKFVKVTRPIY